jgi:hypothetical protein
MEDKREADSLLGLFGKVFLKPGFSGFTFVPFVLLLS